MDIILNILTLIIIILFIRVQYAKGNSFVNLGIFFMFIFSLNYPIRLLFIRFSNEIISDFRLDELRENLFDLSLVTLIAAIFFAIGCLSTNKRGGTYSFLDSDNLIITENADRFIIVTLVISVIAKVIKIATGNYISFLLASDLNYGYANILENMHMLGWLAFAGIYIIFFKQGLNTNLHRKLFFFINFFQLSYQIIQGSKTFLTLPLLIIAFSYYYTRKRIPYVITILLILWLSFVVFPFVTNFRDVMAEEYISLPSFSELNIGYVISDSFKRSFDKETIKSSPLQDESKTGFSKAYSRFNGADQLYQIMKMAPEFMPYKYGSDVVGIFLVLIPRAVWPDKPIFSPGAEYGKALGTITSVTPFPVGEMYWNLGYTGVIIGMFVWGAFLTLLMNLIDKLYIREERRFFIISVFTAELYWYTTGEAMLAVMMASTVKLFIVYTLIYQLINFIFKKR